MARELTLDDALAIAWHVVESYEGAPERALAYQREFGTSDALRERMVEDLRSMCGGETLYRASKAFLVSRARRGRPEGE